MEPRALPPIPVPPARRWSNARMHHVPRLVFALGIVAAALLWSRWLTPSAFLAEAEISGADVRTARGGVLVSLAVTPHGTVRAGQVIGHVAPATPAMIEAGLGVVRAEIDAVAATLQGATDRERLALESARLRLEWVGRRVELSALRGRLRQAEAELARMTPLHVSGMISDEVLGQARIELDTLARQVDELSALVEAPAPLVPRLSAPRHEAAEVPLRESLAAAVRVQEAKLRLAEEQLRPEPLLAPIDGIVSLILREAGETVLPGDVVARVTTPHPVRIHGFLRPPLAGVPVPAPGSTVTVRTRGRSPVAAESTVLAVGAAFEPIPPSLAAALHLPADQPPGSGLRVVIAAPGGMRLRPGEHVDVLLP